MLLATSHWNELIARYVIDNYSCPFDLVLNGFRDSDIVKRVSDELLRNVESPPVSTGLYEYLCSLPDHLFNLICFDAESLLAMNPIDQKRLLDEALRVLSPGGHCTFLIADGVRSGKIVPKGFQLVHRFLSSRYKVVTIMNEQSSPGLPFQLAPHQYLAVFQKPTDRKKQLLRQTTARSRLSLL
ncbi:hypothetical protein [Effusibacillus consociatus]|uniref:Class I SAM-dependent methyltransferase n=1 Tax=Effusibacillus consociatus TaxID=1117041 RepID=A0ABV9Q2U5_9BACL